MTNNDLQEARGHHQAGRLGEAERLYRRILDAQPDAPEILSKLGAALAGQGKLEESATVLGQALAIDPDLAEAASNLGNVYMIHGKPDEAIKSFKRALDINPDLIESHIGLGNILMKQGMAKGAAASYRAALAIDSDSVQAHNGLGAALLALGRTEEAEAAFGQALALDPDHAEAHCNIGNLWRNQGKIDKAVASLQHALALQPGLIEAHINLGNALKSQGDTEGALDSYHRALAIDPKNPETHWNFAQMLLLKGRFKEGWTEYEWRTRCGEFNSMVWNVDGPRWDGGDLQGKTILLYAEQGLGDTIQFVRYARGIAMHGGEVIVKCPPPLSRLIQSAPGVGRVVSRIDRSVPYDVQASLISLPHILGTEEETIPADVPYLSADGTAPLEQAEGLRIGIGWSGNPKHKNDKNRSIDLGLFAPLLETGGCTFYSLQVGDRRRDIVLNGMEGDIIDLGGDLNDFADTAAIMDQMDLIISVDTSIAHLAGALARPVWTLLPFVPDWRWMLNRDDSPWYPSMRLFRQRAAGDWPGVFADVEAALRRRLVTPFA